MAGGTISTKMELQGEQEYRKAIREITQDSKTLASEMKAVTSGFDSNASAQKKAAAQMEVLNKQIQTQKQYLETLRQEQAKYAEGSKDWNTLQEKINKATTALNGMNKEMESLSKITLNPLITAGQSIQSAGEKIQSVGAAVTGIGTKLSAGVTAPIVAAGTASVKLAADFETSMAKLSTIADTSSVSTEALKKQIMDLSNQTGVSASDIASAAYDAISAGQSTADAVNAVSASITLAKSGFTDTATAMDTLTTIQNAYGKSAGSLTDISDRLIETQNLGKTTVAQLGASIGNVIPTANMYGVSLDELCSGYVALTKNGVETSQATTALNSMISELGQSGTGVATILKDKTGKSFLELMQSGYTLTDCLSIIGQAATEQGKSIGDMFSNKNAIKGAAVLTQHANDFNDALSQMGNSAGTTADALEKVSNTTAGKFKKALNESKNLGIEIGEKIMPTVAQVLGQLNDVIGQVTDKWESLSAKQQDQILKLAGVAAAAGPVISVGGKAISTIGSITSGIGQYVQLLGQANTQTIDSLGNITVSSSSAAASFTLWGSVIGGTVAAVELAKVAFDSYNKSVLDGDAAYQQNISDMAQVEASMQASSAAVAQLQQSIDQSNSSYQQSALYVESLKSRLDYCFDSNGNLKEGMQQTAQTILDQLNTAMGTDFSVDFSGHADKVKQSLSDINKAIDDYVNNLKKQSIAEATQTQYAQALENQKSAYDSLKEAQENYNSALEDYAEKVKAAQNNTDPTKIWALQAAAAAAGKTVGEASDNLNKAADSAGQANSTLSDLENVTNQLGAGNIDAAANAYASIGDNAKQAGQDASDAMKKATDDGKKYLDDFSRSQIVSPSVDPSNMDQSALQAGASALYAAQSGLTSSGDLQSPVVDGLNLIQSADNASQQAYQTAQTILQQALTSGTVDNTTVTSYQNEANQAWLGAQNLVQQAMASGTVDQNTLTSYQSVAQQAHDLANQITQQVNQSGTVDQTTLNSYESAAQQAHSLANQISSQILTSGNVDGTTRNSYSTEASNARNAANSTTSQTLKSGNVDGTTQQSYQLQASSAKGAANGITSQTLRSGNVDGTVVSSGRSQASSAHGQMQGIMGNTLSAHVSVTNASSAASSAWGSIKSFFANNPITVAVRTITGHASGGLVTHETISALAEGNKAEMVIPLQAEHQRAVGLWKQAGHMLGVTMPQTVVSVPVGSSSSSSTTNYGGITVVVNAAEGQSAEEIADYTIDKIKNELAAKRAVYA